MGRVIKAAPSVLHLVPYATTKKPPEPDEGRLLLTALVFVLVGVAVTCGWLQ